MKFAAVLLGFGSLAFATLFSATGVVIDDSVDDDADGHHRRVFRLSAKCGHNEVLVVRGTRWEDDRKVLEIEEVIAATDGGTATFEIGLVEAAPNYWQLREPGAEQHLEGLRLGRIERQPAILGVELQPVAGRAQRTYRFSWEARIETKPAAGGGSSRKIFYSIPAAPR